MPLRRIEWTEKQCGWALWHITETEEELAAGAFPEVCPGKIVTVTKRLEWLGGRYLLKYLAEKAGLSFQGLLKDEFGKPSLERHEHHISLSHSYPYVAAQIDDRPVGIDVEQPKDKLLRIAHRVFNTSETLDAGPDLTKLCLYWCAKEALYKIHGEGGISFSKNLKVEPFAMTEKGQINGMISINGKDRFIKLGYRVEDNFVVVFTKTN